MKTCYSCYFCDHIGVKHEYYKCKNYAVEKRDDVWSEAELCPFYSSSLEELNHNLNLVYGCPHFVEELDLVYKYQVGDKIFAWKGYFSKDEDEIDLKLKYEEFVIKEIKYNFSTMVLYFENETFSINLKDDSSLLLKKEYPSFIFNAILKKGVKL